MPSVTIFGAGKAGSSLGRHLHRAGYKIVEVVTRHLPTARRARVWIGAGRPATHVRRKADIFLIGVPDDAIEGAGAALAETGLVKDSVVLHLCGSYSSAILDRARRAGASTGSLHPLRSFADPEAPFEGTYCGIEGMLRARRTATRMVRAMGGIPVLVSSRGKPVYHAAAVLASNALTALLDAAIELFRQGAIAEPLARRMAIRLARGTLGNIERLGTVRALTGPIRRGDVRTLRIQMKALAPLGKNLIDCYRVLAIRTVSLARRAGANPSHLAEILRLLSRQ